ncbi:MAG TPA: hypothetical protein VIN93_04825 [Bryobacteraceae bacterium]
MTPETAARLAGCGIQLAAESPEYSMFTRGSCVALANPGAAAGIGSTGMMTETGLAFLVWREGLPYLAAKGRETPASSAQVDEIRKFSLDLKRALGVDSGEA